MSYNPGDIISGKYRIVSEIGGGAMGIVYHAVHEAIGMDVAIKVLHGDYAESDEFRRRFQREARAAAMLKHSNICTVSDFATIEEGDRQESYLVMELLEGETLKTRMQHMGRFPVSVAVSIMRQLVSALYCAHQNKIVHRDIKPDNIFLIERDGMTDFVKLIDFGIAHLDKAEGDLKTLTQAGQIYGTPQYLSPEQALGDSVDFRADLYACGVIFYEMLVGEPPFDGKNYIELLHKQIAEAPPHLPSTIPQYKKLDPIIQRLLKKEPAKRYDSGLEVIQLLDRIKLDLDKGEDCGADLSEIKSVSVGDKLPARSGMFVGLGVVVIIMISLAGAFLSKGESGSEPAVKQEVQQPAEFVYEAQAWDISSDSILTQDSNIMAAVKYLDEKKFDIAFALLEASRIKYWEHPNFVWLYMQTCQKIDKKPGDFRDKAVEASIQLMRLTKNAARNEAARKIFHQYYQAIWEHSEVAEVASVNKAAILSDLILHSPYDMHRNRLQAYFKAYDTFLEEGEIDAWKRDALELWRFPKDKCKERLESLESLLSTHPEHIKETYDYVIRPFDASTDKNCGKKSSGFLDFEKKVDCNSCMRTRLKALLTEYDKPAASEHEVLPGGVNEADETGAKE